MEITIKAEPEEVAAFIQEIQLPKIKKSCGYQDQNLESDMATGRGGLKPVMVQHGCSMALRYE